MALGLSYLRKRKIHGRRHSARFMYRVQLLEIKPWVSSPQAPASSQHIAADSFVLRWHRGAHRSGLAQSNMAYHGLSDGTIHFHHAFELPVTLHRSYSSAAFEEKLILFTLLDAEYPAGPPIAGGSLNLAAYGASGMDINGPVTSAAHVPLILCRHAASKVVIPHLHILITPGVCKRACFGEGECQYKAQYIIRYLPTGTVRMLRKQEASPPPLDSSSRQAAVAALLEEEDEHQEEEEEAEIEPFTEDESSSGLHTPHEESSSDEHPKANNSVDSNSPPLSSRISAAQFAWTPTPRRHGLDEAMTPLKTAPDFYHSSKENFITLSQDSSGTIPSPYSASTLNETQHEHIKIPSDSQQGLGSDNKRFAHAMNSPSVLQNVACMQQESVMGMGHLVEKRRGAMPTEAYYDQANVGLAGLKMHKHPTDNNDIGSLQQRITSQLHENSLLGLSLEDPDTDNDDIFVVEDINVLEEARRKFAEGVDRRDAKVTKRLLEETKVKLIDAEVKLFAASEKVSFLHLCMGALEGELQDAATIEMSVFCTVVEHGETPSSVLSCACRLYKLHNHVIAKWSQHRKESLMRSTVSGILLATRACGQNVARLTFWWSNVLALRHALASRFKTTSPVTSSSEFSVVLEASPFDPEIPVLRNTSAVCEGGIDDSSNAASFITALEKVEASIYVKVVEYVWLQVFAPLTYKAAYPSLQQGRSSDSVDKDDAQSSKDHERTSMVFDLNDGMQQNASIDIWKNAFLDALQKICPVLSEGNICSCVSGLPRLVIEECVSRLDALMFNAILPIPVPESELLRKPISDVVLDAELLPISPGHMTFGAGVQLKNVVSTWSTWLTILLEKLTISTEHASNDESRRFISFPLLKALADLLMLPRDMVADKSVRREVCPALTLRVVRRIISMVEPDDFAPDTVSPSLLAALNAEIDMERRMLGDAERHGFSVDGVALEPKVAYFPHSTAFKELIESKLDSTISKWARQDDGIMLHDLKTMSAEFVQTFDEVMAGTMAANHLHKVQDTEKQHTCGVPLQRYKLLEELCVSEFTGKAPNNVVSEDL